MKIKNLFAAVIVLLLSAHLVKAEDFDISKLPKLLGASNSGKEFYLTFHPCWEEIGYNNAIRIYVSSTFETNVTLEITGIGKVQKLKIPPYQVGEFKLSPLEAQMYSKGNGSEPIPPLPEQVFPGKGIKITSDEPIICYGVTRYQYTSDGFLALPVYAWGKNYRIGSYADPTDNTKQFLPSYSSIVAAYDNTEVEITLPNIDKCIVKSEGGNIMPGQSKKRKLNAGDVWLLAGTGTFNDLTGINVKATKPVGVISGNYCAYIPSNIGYCDYIIEQDIPTDAWGSTYFVPQIVNRKKPGIVKIFASEDETDVKIDGIPFYNLNPSMNSLNQVFVETRTHQGEPRPVVISSDKNINVVLYNPGQADDNVPSDPFQMNITPYEQFQKEVSLNTPGIRGGFGFRDNYLNLIYKEDSLGNIPDNIMFGELFDGKISWMQLKIYSPDKGEKFQFNPFGDTLGYYSKTIRLPYDGVFALKSDVPFAAHGYGFSDYDSYGFQLSGAFKNISSGDTMPPQIKMLSLGNGNYEFEVTETGNIAGKTVKNEDEFTSKSGIPSGLSFVDMIKSFSYNYKMVKEKLVPGSDKYTFSLRRIEPEKDGRAVLVISDQSGNDSVIVIDKILPNNGVPEFLAENYNYGVLKNGQKSVKTIKIINNSDEDTKAIKSLIFDKDIPELKVLNQPNNEIILRKGESFEFQTEFEAGTSDFVHTARLGLNIDGMNAFMKDISAEVSNPTISLTDYDFTNNYVIGNPEQSSEILITNTGKTELVIHKAEFSQSHGFKSEITDISTNNKLIVNPQSELKVKISFKADYPGEYRDTLKLYSDGKKIKDVSYLHAVAVVNSVEELDNLSNSLQVIQSGKSVSFKTEQEFMVKNVKIYDINGNVYFISSDVNNINNLKIDTQLLNQGSYFVEIESDKGKFTRKFNLVY